VNFRRKEDKYDPFRVEVFVERRLVTMFGPFGAWSDVTRIMFVLRMGV
jgi:hypothetical protein